MPLRSRFTISPGLPAADFQDRALLVGQDDRLRAADHGGAGGGGAIDALDIRRAEDVADAADQVGLRSAEGEAVAQAADGQRIAAAAERERPAAARDAADPARLDEGDAHGAAVGARGGEARQHGGERDDDDAQAGHFWLL